MTDREKLHKLLDQLSDDVLPAVADYLEAVSAGCPPDDPWDDEPVTAEDLAAIAEGRAAFERGEYITDTELRARLNLRPGA